MDRPPWIRPSPRGTRRALALAVAAALAFAALAGLVTLGLMQSLDQSVMNVTGVFRTPPSERLMLEVTAISDGGVVLATTIILLVFLWQLRRRRAARFLAISVVGGLGVLAILKLSFGRARPLTDVEGTGTSSSAFPSGHSMSAVILYGALLLLLDRFGAGRSLRRFAFIYALGVVLAAGFSRVALGVHHLSDVLAGYLAGIGWLALTVALDGWERLREKSTDAAMASPRPESDPGATIRRRDHPRPDSGDTHPRSDRPRTDPDTVEER